MKKNASEPEKYKVVVLGGGEARRFIAWSQGA
jgi:hypothetical protein